MRVQETLFLLAIDYENLKCKDSLFEQSKDPCRCLCTYGGLCDLLPTIERCPLLHHRQQRREKCEVELLRCRKCVPKVDDNPP